MAHTTTVLPRPRLLELPTMRESGRARPAAEQPEPDRWACDNCDTVNESRRRRCADCRTSRW